MMVSITNDVFDNIFSRWINDLEGDSGITIRVTVPLAQSGANAPKSRSSGDILGPIMGWRTKLIAGIQINESLE